MLNLRLTLLAAAALMPLPATAFSINLNFTGGLSASQEVIFEDAAQTWESLITGYQPGITRTGITVDVEAIIIDGLDGILGTAGPSGATKQQGFWLTTTGSVSLDTVDLDAIEADGRLQEVALHELAHVIGYGTLWTQNSVYANGTGQYTGAFALDAYKSEFDPSATYVPVELEGGGGTIDGHWNEVNLGGGLTGITDQYGRDFANELMTGWDTPHPPTGVPNYVSQTTISSFADIGYTVVPEPATGLLAALTLLAAAIRRHRA